MEGANGSRSLIIAGMHRSQTSLVTQALAGAGLFVGDDLIGPDNSNIHGHFESKSIVDFHRMVLEQQHLLRWYDIINVQKARAYSLTSEFQERAASLIQKNFAKRLFGWKDPRVAFFLEGWHHVLPDPYYILVVRHPVNCVQSLIRRSMGRAFIKHRPLLATRYFNLWDGTNKCLLDFLNKHPDRCLVLHTPDDLMDEDRVTEMNRIILNIWNLDIKKVDFNTYYDPSLVTSRHASGYIAMMYKYRKSTQDLYDTLLNER